MNLSDLAAKGATPLGFLLAIALPKGFSEDWLAAFARGLGEDADRYQCPLLGGDTDSTPGPISISISAFGTLPQGTMPRRSGARVGDHVFVSGTIGDAALGLQVRQDAGAGKAWKLDAAMCDYLVARYRVPQPRNALAAAVRAHASAAMDVSDGLAGDLAKLCRASNVSADIAVARVPLSPAAAQALAGRCDADRADPHRRRGLRDPLRGFATGRRFHAAAQAAGVAVTEIGRIVAGDRPPRFLDRAGRALAFSRPGYSHF